MKLMLTSAGFKNPNLMEHFLRLLPCKSDCARALFLPTAAIHCDAIEMLPACLTDLYRAGISRQNIVVYDLHRPMTVQELSDYDCIYLCGGDTEYLAARIREACFHQSLLSYLAKGNGAVVGVSAGSLIFSEKVRAGLALLPHELHVHCAHGSPDGALPGTATPIFLTNNQCILFEGDAAPCILS